VAFVLGINITRQTEEADVQNLIARLHPVNCGRPLIRVGAESDGGYLLPDDLDGIEYCFSPGVGLLSDFENHLAAFNIRSFLADGSIDILPIERPEFTFDRQFVGACDTESSTTLEAWKDEYLPKYRGDLLLQMDIEGAEYEVILGTPMSVLKSFRIMVVEFHFLEKLFDPFVFCLYRATFDKILQHFYVAHIHPNNCYGSVCKGAIEIPRIMEFTFYNKSRVSDVSPRSDFPHALDRENAPGKHPLVLPICWYKSARTGQ